MRDLPLAIATADGLVDFRISSSSPLQPKTGNDSGKTSPSKRDGRRNKGGSKKSKSGDSQEKKDLGCFICDGPHRAKDCPKRDKINAMVKKTEVALSVAEASTSRMNPLQLMNALREEVVDNNTNQGLMVSIV